MPRPISTLRCPSSVSVAFFVFSSTITSPVVVLASSSSSPTISRATTSWTLRYFSTGLPRLAEMINGTRASSIRIESTSSTIA